MRHNSHLPNVAILARHIVFRSFIGTIMIIDHFVASMTIFMSNPYIPFHPLLLVGKTLMGAAQGW
jgi:hypothetical protein